MPKTPMGQGGPRRRNMPGKFSRPPQPPMIPPRVPPATSGRSSSSGGGCVVLIVGGLGAVSAAAELLHRVLS